MVSTINVGHLGSNEETATRTIDDMETDTNRPINDANEILWNYFQKCIHGFKPRPANEMNASNRVESSTDGITEDGTSTKQRLAKRQRDSGSADGTAASNSSKRKSGVGIKHFRTNRIRLKCQKNYLDRYFCLFIVPVMTMDEVKDWNGSNYTAIVLACDYVNDNDRQSESAQVYQKISAFRGNIEFAVAEDCNKACALLEAMVLCVCKSSRDTFTQEFHKREPLLKFFLETSDESPKYIKRDGSISHVCVPRSKQWNSTNRVRKITFSDSNAVNNNPAPDPVLLLGKAASNWLKRQKLNILPGCDGSDDDNSRCNSSKFTASLCDEIEMRGWSTDVFARPPIKGIVEVSSILADAIDEALSDDEEY